MLWVFYLPFFGFLLFSCLCDVPFVLPLLFIFLLHPGVLFIPPTPPLHPPPPPPPPSLWPCGHRPYGLEEDVRQYEQDLAKRLYQARVRASQGTAAAPQPPTSSSTSSSAASQLRSAPRPRPAGGQTHGIVWVGVGSGGGVLGCFGVGVFC